MTIQDMTYEQWIEWMKACPKGITLYLEDEDFEKIADRLSESGLFIPPLHPTYALTFRGTQVTIRRASYLLAQGENLGRTHERENILSTVEQWGRANRGF